MTGTPTTADAHALLLRGTLALAKMENNGIAVDVPYLKQARAGLLADVAGLEEQMREDPVYRTWQKLHGQKTNLGSRAQLAKVLYGPLGFKPHKYTAKSAELAEGERRYSTDEASLDEIDLPFVRHFVEAEKKKKAVATYIDGILREEVGGYVRPSFSLNTVRSFRSCVAAGSLVETVRDVSGFPKGVPIEAVRAGDFVYCYDDRLRLVVRKVLWAGKTGRRRVLRLHWVARGKRGHLDVTPEHRVRLADGSYLPAEALLPMAERRVRGRATVARVLAMGRTGDRVYETGNPISLHDHRLVYQELVGPLASTEVVHHRDGNHLNNRPDNLEKLTLAAHAALHAPDSLTDDARRAGVRARQENHRKYGDRWASGEDNSRWLPLTRFSLLRHLCRAKGRPTEVPFDFSTFKKHAESLGVDLAAVRDRYDADKRYISRGRLCHVFDGQVRQVVTAFRISYPKAMRLLAGRGISYLPPGKATNPNGRRGGKVHNHRVTHVEWVRGKADVYDLEIEGEHNFIVNEICVHNSCDSPNMMNVPVRISWLMDVVRKAVVARPGRRLAEVDFGAIEVRVSACHNRDPNLIKYLTDPTTDMHRDAAQDLYKYSRREWKALDPKLAKVVRYNAKNKFVFPQFYGSYYAQCAPALWKAALTCGLRDHLEAKGITGSGACDPEERPLPGTFEHHVRAVERDFWDVRFPVYRDWKRSWYDAYLKAGEFRSLTGFTYKGLYRKNEVLNLATQGDAFQCLLWSLAEVQDEFARRRMQTKVVLEVHDSMLLDAPEAELDEALALAKEVMTVRLPAAWKWLTVPLEVEAEVSPPGGSWADKVKYN